MVRRRLLSSSAKQASMSAYQNFWHQHQQQLRHQQRPQSPLVVPQYLNSMCHKLGGAAPVAPPRRQLVKQPRAAPEQQHLPLQRDYQTVWGRCCGQQGPLLKPGAIMPAFPHLGYSQVPPPTALQQPQRHFQYQQGNFLSYPAAVQMQQMWHHQQQQQQQLPQPHGPVPVGILKKTSQLESAGVHNAKRVTIKAPATFQAPIVEPLKPRTEVPRRTSKRMRQHLLRREQQKVLQHQMFYHKQLQKQQQAQTELRQQKRLQRRLLKKQEQQHRQELEKVQQQIQEQRMKQQQLREANEQHRKAQRLLERSNYFNFGKIASNFLENSDPEIPRPGQTPQNLGRNQNFSYHKTIKCPDRTKLQEKPEVPRKKVNANREGKTHSLRLKDTLDLGNESSTITLTTEQSLADYQPARTPNRSGTSLVDRATNTQSASMSELLKKMPQKVISDTGKGGARKLNINELLKREQVKGLNADPMCQSLMELVTLMCESQDDPESRLKAGSGGDDGGLRKKYTVYLMVTSDEEEDEGKRLPRSEKNSTHSTGDERIQGEDEEFSERCGKAYQDEYSRLSPRKRTRRRLSSRLDDLDCFSSGPLPFPPMRRPLHWPKPDYSKLSQGRSNRVRSRSSSKQILQMRSPRSMCSVLDPKRSWKLWEDLPMTAKTLNKAYSRLWSKSGGQSCTKF